jgi:hypothetical protein
LNEGSHYSFVILEAELINPGWEIDVSENMGETLEKSRNT